MLTKPKRTKISTLETPYLLMAVYGTLRISDRSEWYKDYTVDTKLVRTATFTNYKMYDIGGLPMVMESTSPSDTIEIDIIKVTPTRFKQIADMEIRAGYKEGKTRKQTDDSNNRLPIWLANGSWETKIGLRKLHPDDHILQIDSGNWLAWRKEKYGSH